MKKIALLFMVFCLTAGPLYAQSYPRGEVFMGYALMRNFDFKLADNEVGGFTLNGWNFGLSYNLNRTVGIIGEVGGNYGSQTFKIGNDTIKDTANFHTLLIGPRLYARSNSRWTPFVHAMVGTARENHDGFNENTNKNITFTVDGGWNLAVAVGGGLDYNINPRASFRFGQLDYRYTTGDMKSNFRYCVGLLVKF